VELRGDQRLHLRGAPGPLAPGARRSPRFSQLARNNPAMTKAGPAIVRIQISLIAGGNRARHGHDPPDIQEPAAA